MDHNKQMRVLLHPMKYPNFFPYQNNKCRWAQKGQKGAGKYL